MYKRKGNIRFWENEGGYTSPTFEINGEDVADAMYNIAFDVCKQEDKNYRTDYGNMKDVPGKWEIIIRRIKC